LNLEPPAYPGQASIYIYIYEIKGSNQNLENVNNVSYSDKVKRAEILAAFLTKYNIAFSTIDHLIL